MEVKLWVDLEKSIQFQWIEKGGHDISFGGDTTDGIVWDILLTGDYKHDNLMTAERTYCHHTGLALI